jgi:hypothetical protein
MFAWFRRKPQQDDSPPEWMVVYSTDNLPEAHIVAGRLQNEDIPSWVHQQPGASGLGITIGLFGEIRVLVNAQDYDRAKALLADDAEPPLLEDKLDDIRYVFPNTEQGNGGSSDQT